MRPNQNRRMRGRNRPKGPNPLTRSYESNGPDVKIRGTAQHIADKYAQLARDALASGDPIAAENYFQHGEHYFRIITSAQDQTRPASTQGYANNAYGDEEEGDEEAQGAPQGFSSQNGEQGRQGYGDDYNDPAQLPQPYERHDFENRQNRNDRPERQDRRDRFQNRGERPQRFDNNRQDFNRGEPRQDQRPDYGPRQERGRQEYGRQEYGRPDNNRPDHGRQDSRQDGRQDSRQDSRTEGRPEGRQDSRQEGRYDNNRNEPPRQDESRSEGPRSEEAVSPRRDRRREEAPRAEDTSGLPAFLMTATRNPPPPEPVSKEPSAPEPETPTVAAGEDDSAPVRKPRRRRTRYKIEDGQEASQDAPAPADAPVGE